MERKPGTQSVATDGPKNSEDSKSPLPVVSLPKGGGAITGIGEKFSVNPVTGTGSLSVPISTSPGRSGFHPQLSLSYDSGAGNGPFGFGWHLSIPAIARKTDKGLPRYFDGDLSDVFLLSDAEDLMPLLSLQGNEWLAVQPPDGTWGGDAYAITRYRPRTEGLFARIERWRRKADGDTHWRSVTKENVTSLYGFNSGCRIADPSDPTRVFRWLLEATFDDKGNVIFYEYKPEDTTGIDSAAANEQNRQNENAPYTNLYIKRIHYGNLTPHTKGENLSHRTDWLFEVVFDYGEHAAKKPVPSEDPALTWVTRADPFSSFRSTFDIRTYRLCQRVLMFHHFPKGQYGEEAYDGIVRSTDFSYEKSDPLSPLAGNPVATKLLSVTQTGYSYQTASKSYLTNSFPPLEFTYSAAAIDSTVQRVDPDSLENVPSGVNGSNYQWVDLDGEGSAGILTAQGAAMFYKRNLSPANVMTTNGLNQTSARFGPLEIVALQPSTVTTGEKPQLMDLAADGHQDIVSLDRPMRGYFTRSDGAGWEGMVPFPSFPNLDTRDPNLRFVDVDGDGLADLLVSEDNVFAWYPSLGYGGFGERHYAVKPFDEEKGACLVFDDPTQSIFLADLTGDGLSDIVRIRNGEVCYWPNRGYGVFGARVTMDNAPRFDTPDLFDPRRIRLADIDGGGNADILYLAARGVAIFYNQSGNGWSEEFLLPDVPQINDIASVNVTDLLGIGTACLVWSSPLPSDTGSQMQYINLMGNQKPHLLVGVKNNLGAETRVRYASSNKFYVQDLEAGTPWVTKLPFPVYVVERSEVFDYVGRTRHVSTYRYRHGYFDGVEREFRGFGYVEQRDADSLGNTDSLFTQDTDTEALHLPPVVTRTWFHTGAWPDEETTIHHMSDDYYSASSEGPLLPDTILPTDILQSDNTRATYTLTDEEQREAVRALKGSILRQEIYADDGTDKSQIPYSVSERNYTVECFQPQGNNRYAVFFTHGRETIDYHHERNTADPRVAHNAVLNVDPSGNVLQSISVGYGRNQKSSGLASAPVAASGTPPDLTKDASSFVQPEQTTALITLSENTFTGIIDEPDAYRTPMPAENCTYEVTRPARLDESVVYSFDELQRLAASALEIAYETTPDLTQVQKRLVRDIRTLYLKDDLSGPMPSGQMDTLGLVYETYKLAFTANLAQQNFINNNSNPNKPADPATLSGILKDVGSVIGGAFSNAGGGYVNSQGDTNWWIPSGLILYDEANFYLPKAHRDPFGQLTQLMYDSYDLLLRQTQDALGNTIVALSDYRVLQPESVTDPNGNVTEVRFDALGMVVGTAVEGKVTGANTESGDSFLTFTADLLQPDIDSFIGAANPLPLAPGLLGTATTRIVYDLDRFWKAFDPNDTTTWKPVCATTLARETHVANVPAGQQSKVQVSFSYSDGLGREIQKKIQAEPGPLDLSDPKPAIADPRWVGSGWTVFNNKGKPVRQYEPFFSATSDFEFANKTGVTATLFYDPLERVVVTLHPNNTWEKVVFDPWLQKTWDVNDTVRMDPTTDADVVDLFSLLPDGDYLPTWYQTRTDVTQAAAAFPDATVRAAELGAANKTAAHNDTPTAALFDALGRQFLSVAHNRYQKSGATVDEYYTTRTKLDVEGNPLSVTDALGRIVMRYDYGMLKSLIHQASMEAGERWMLNNAMGKPIRSWDSRAFARTLGYDELQRPVALNLTGNGPDTILTEKTIYGDSKTGGPVNPKQTNHLTKVYQLYDAAGIVTNLGQNPATGTNEGYDFKGNLLRSNRQLLDGTGYRSTVDWNQNPVTGEMFTGFSRYDALNRVIQQVSPHSDQMGTKVNVTQPTYNNTNLLETVDVWLQQTNEPAGLLDPTSASLHAVTNIDYNAKGQRTLIEYGILDASQKSRVNTAYAYDAVTFRLTNLTTTRKSDGALLQDLLYYYDPAGNITHLQDDADIQNVVYFKNKRVEPGADYVYDATYRLIRSTGREHLGQTGGVPNAPTPTSYNDWPNLNLPHPNDGKAMGTYVENYSYDPAGNFLQLQHAGSDPANPGWTRAYACNETSELEPGRQNNRLTGTTLGGTRETYSNGGDGYDAHGNMLHLPQLSGMSWDFKDQLQMTQRQALNTGNDPDGSLHNGQPTYYVYDLSGQRVRKVTESGGTKVKERIYLGGFEIYREYTGANAGLERQTLHVMDDQQRVAMVEIRNPINDGTPPQLVRFQFANHLGTACLELDDKAQVISYEEYYPYGSTSYQAVNPGIKAAAKRYRYTSKERDEESGLCYHGARYYSPWIIRWLSCDPIGISSGPNLFVYVRNNPVLLNDPSGMADEAPEAPPEVRPESYTTEKDLGDGKKEFTIDYTLKAEIEAGPGFGLKALSLFGNQTNPADGGPDKGQKQFELNLIPQLTWNDKSVSGGGQLQFSLRFGLGTYRGLKFDAGAVGSFAYPASASVGGIGHVEFPKLGRLKLGAYGNAGVNLSDKLPNPQGSVTLAASLELIHNKLGLDINLFGGGALSGSVGPADVPSPLTGGGLAQLSVTWDNERNSIGFEGGASFTGSVQGNPQAQGSSGKGIGGVNFTRIDTQTGSGWSVSVDYSREFRAKVGGQHTSPTNTLFGTLTFFWALKPEKPQDTSSQK